MDEIAAFARWAVLLLGAVYFVTQSVIFSIPRVLFARLGAWAAIFVYCASCTGFWVGLLLGPWFWPWRGWWWAMALESGAAAMAVAHVWVNSTGGNPLWQAEAALRGEEETE